MLQRHLGTRGGLLPGQYCVERDVNLEYVKAICLACPDCGGVDNLGNGHVIDRQGRVTPAWGLPDDHVRFSRMARARELGRGAVMIKRLVVALLVTVGCVHAARTPLRDLTVAQQAHQAVWIDVYCDGFDEFSGSTYQASGGIVSSRHVLTARHVFDACPGAIPTIRVYVAGDRQPYRMVWYRWLDGDQVLLQRADAGGWAWAERPRVAQARRGDAVCAETVSPFRRRRCGDVQDRYMRGAIEAGRPVRYEVDTVPGNSGSLLYDRQGHLVGVHSAHAPGTTRALMVPVDWRDMP